MLGAQMDVLLQIFYKLLIISEDIAEPYSSKAELELKGYLLWNVF